MPSSTERLASPKPSMKLGIRNILFLISTGTAPISKAT